MDHTNFKFISDYLSCDEILLCAQVCKRWKEFAQSDSIWKERTLINRSFKTCGTYKQVKVEHSMFDSEENDRIENKFFKHSFPISGFLDYGMKFSNNWKILDFLK